MTELQTEDMDQDAVSADSAAGETVEDATDTKAGDESQDGENPSREAAKYRRKLRDAEGERDALAGQLDSARRQIVEHLAESQGTTLAALEFCGSSVADLTDEDGLVDHDAVTQAVQNARVQLGGKPHMSKPDPAQGQNGGPAISGTFEEAFRP